MNAAENEQNAYHIDGDEDDENTSGNKDKLMAALSSDPDTVIDFMKQLSTNLYTAIDKQMQTNSLRSRYSIYNDKEMTSQYTSYTKTIAEWETKISDKEYYYYKKFSKMETEKIIEEFQATLDHKYPVAKDFEAVYSYLLKRLFDANIRKDPEILEEVLRHLRTMRDTWKEVMAKTANGNNIKTKEPVA